MDVFVLIAFKLESPQRYYNCQHLFVYSFNPFKRLRQEMIIGLLDVEALDILAAQKGKSCNLSGGKGRARFYR